MSSCCPSPDAPTSEAITTIASVCMMTWFSPTISVWCAAGSCTFQRSWRGVQPAMRPDSTTSAGTVRMPRIVQRAIGGMAKTMVASIAGTWPNPNSTTTGTK